MFLQKKWPDEFVPNDGNCHGWAILILFFFFIWYYIFSKLYAINMYFFDESKKS